MVAGFPVTRSAGPLLMRLLQRVAFDLDDGHVVPARLRERGGKLFHARRCALVGQDDEVDLAILRGTHRGTDDKEGDADEDVAHGAQSYTAWFRWYALGVGYEPSREST